MLTFLLLLFLPTRFLVCVTAELGLPFSMAMLAYPILCTPVFPSPERLRAPFTQWTFGTTFLVILDLFELIEFFTAVRAIGELFAFDLMVLQPLPIFRKFLPTEPALRTRHL
jgi:hypothetical protein